MPEVVVTREGDSLRIAMPLLASRGYAVGSVLEPLMFLARRDREATRRR